MGISSQDLASHEAFVAKHSLNVPLLADVEKDVARKYAAVNALGVKRAVIVIDEQGVVRHRHDHLLGRVRERHTVVAVTAFSQLADSAHRGICDGAIVVQDSQRIEICLEFDVLTAAASGVEDLHAYDRRDPHSIVVPRCTDEPSQITAER